MYFFKSGMKFEFGQRKCASGLRLSGACPAPKSGLLGRRALQALEKGFWSQGVGLDPDPSMC